MYSSRAPILSVCIESVRDRKRHSQSRQHCVAIKRSSGALCNSTMSRCSTAMHVLAYMHTYTYTHVKVMTYCLRDIFIKRYEDIRLVRTDIMCSSMDKHLLCTISSDNLWLLYCLELPSLRLHIFFLSCFCLLSCLERYLVRRDIFYNYNK